MNKQIQMWLVVAASWVSLGVGVATGQVVTGELAYGITHSTGSSSAENVVTFFTNNPGTILTNVPIVGIPTGHSVRAIDFRPSDMKLYALSTAPVIGTGTVEGLLYTVTVTGSNAVLTPVSSSPFIFPANPGDWVSIDFDPVSDRLRVVSLTNSLNFELNPNTGAISAVYSALAYGASDPYFGFNPPQAAGVAFSNNFVGATTTRMYVWDQNIDVLSFENPLTSGTLTSLTPFPPPGVTVDAALGFDISGYTGNAYLSYRSAGFERLGLVNLGTGAVTFIGTFPVNMLDISIAFIPEPSTVVLSSAGIVSVLFVFRRRRGVNNAEEEHGLEQSSACDLQTM